MISMNPESIRPEHPRVSGFASSSWVHALTGPCVVTAHSMFHALQLNGIISFPNDSSFLQQHVFVVEDFLHLCYLTFMFSGVIMSFMPRSNVLYAES